MSKNSRTEAPNLKSASPSRWRRTPSVEAGYRPHSQNCQTLFWKKMTEKYKFVKTGQTVRNRGISAIIQWLRNRPPTWTTQTCILRNSQRHGYPCKEPKAQSHEALETRYIYMCHFRHHPPVAVKKITVRFCLPCSCHSGLAHHRRPSHLRRQESFNGS